MLGAYNPGALGQASFKRRTSISPGRAARGTSNARSPRAGGAAGGMVITGRTVSMPAKRGTKRPHGMGPGRRSDTAEGSMNAGPQRRGQRSRREVLRAATALAYTLVRESPEQQQPQEPTTAQAAVEMETGPHIAATVAQLRGSQIPPDAPAGVKPGSVIAECIRRFRSQPPSSREERAKLREASASPISETDFWWVTPRSRGFRSGEGGGGGEVGEGLGGALHEEGSEGEEEKERKGQQQESTVGHAPQPEDEAGDGEVEMLASTAEHAAKRGSGAQMTSALSGNGSTEDIDVRASLLLQRWKSVLEELYLPDATGGGGDEGLSMDDGDEDAEVEGDDAQGGGLDMQLRGVPETYAGEGEGLMEATTFGEEGDDTDEEEQLLRYAEYLSTEVSDSQHDEDESPMLPGGGYEDELAMLGGGEAVEDLLHEALRLSLEKPEEAVRRLRDRLGLGPSPPEATVQVHTEEALESSCLSQAESMQQDTPMDCQQREDRPADANGLGAREGGKSPIQDEPGPTTPPTASPSDPSVSAGGTADPTPSTPVLEHGDIGATEAKEGLPVPPTTFPHPLPPPPPPAAEVEHRPPPAVPSLLPSSPAQDPPGRRPLRICVKCIDQGTNPLDAAVPSLQLPPPLILPPLTSPPAPVHVRPLMHEVQRSPRPTPESVVLARDLVSKVVHRGLFRPRGSNFSVKVQGEERAMPPAGREGLWGGMSVVQQTIVDVESSGGTTVAEGREEEQGGRQGQPKGGVPPVEAVVPQCSSSMGSVQKVARTLSEAARGEEGEGRGGKLLLSCEGPDMQMDDLLESEEYGHDPIVSALRTRGRELKRRLAAGTVVAMESVSKRSEAVQG